MGIFLTIRDEQFGPKIRRKYSSQFERRFCSLIDLKNLSLFSANFVCNSQVKISKESVEFVDWTKRNCRQPTPRSSQESNVRFLDNISIGAKLKVVMLVFLFTGLLVYGAVAYLSFRSFEQNLLGEVRSVAKVITNNAKPSLLFADKQSAAQILNSLSGNENIKSAVIYDQEWNEVASFGEDLSEGEEVNFEAHELIKNDTISGMYDIRSETAVIGHLHLIASFESVYKNLINHLKLSCFIFIPALILVGLLLRQVTKRMATPIEVLAQSIETVTHKEDYGTRVPTTDRKDEIGALTQGFNTMLEQIQDRDQKLRAATKAKSDFLANMSHEIRTPLNNILGMLEMSFDKDPKPSGEVAHCIRMAQTSSDTLLTVINDILDFSKIEAGMLVVDPTTFNLREQLQHITLPMFLRSKEKGILTNFEIADNVPEELFTDKNRIAQILNNLLSNAMKFTSSDKDLGVRVSYETGATQEKSFVKFEVWDSGIGIPEEKQEEIFKSFSQADVSTTRKYGGTGLGLAIARDLTVCLGGRMWVESEVDVGSRFFFTIPDRQESNANAESADPSLETQQQFGAGLEKPGELKILLVEDNPLSREVALHRLKKLGDKVECAVNGLEAVEKWQAGEFDLILMDWHMPVMDGLDATRKIRELEKSKTTRTAILALTANALDGQANACLEAGMDGYISKPIKENELFTAINELLASQKQSGESLG